MPTTAYVPASLTVSADRLVRLTLWFARGSFGVTPAHLSLLFAAELAARDGLAVIEPPALLGLPPEFSCHLWPTALAFGSAATPGPLCCTRWSRLSALALLLWASRAVQRSPQGMHVASLQPLLSPWARLAAIVSPLAISECVAAAVGISAGRRCLTASVF